MPRSGPVPCSRGLIATAGTPPDSGGADLNQVSAPDEGFCFGSGLGRDEAGDGGFGGIHGSEDAVSQSPAGEPRADEKDQRTVRGAVLAQPVQTGEKIDPHSGATVVFRAKRGNRLKVLLWDGAGTVLTDKVPEPGGFAWPKVHDRVLRLSRAQVEGLDRRRVKAQQVPPPAAAG